LTTLRPGRRLRPSRGGGGIPLITGSSIRAISLALLLSVALVPIPAHAQRAGGLARGSSAGTYYDTSPYYQPVYSPPPTYVLPYVPSAANTLSLSPP